MSALILHIVLLGFCLIESSLSPAIGGTVISVSSASELQRMFQSPVDSVEIYLEAGEYHLTPTSFRDSTCGNCEDPATPVDATVGLHLRGRRIHLIGPRNGTAVIHTNAGYGLFFERCEDGLVEGVTITGGSRDTNANATNAAIVVKNSRVVIRNTTVTNNFGDSATVAAKVVGVMGICGRENSHLTITGSRIVRNSWDGIALYRDAVATIEGNVVDGVDKARGQHIGGGRGVGIGVTWNARAAIRGNLVTRYWKGIGVFVDAQATVENNIVEDILTWGIAYWDADKGRPIGFIENNIIYKTGACGASITRSRDGESAGTFMGNVIVETAQNEKYDAQDYYCYQCALALHAVPAGFLIADNSFYNNRRATSDLPDYDMQRAEFMKAIAGRCRAMAQSPVFRLSQFARDFCKE